MGSADAFESIALAAAELDLVEGDEGPDARREAHALLDARFLTFRLAAGTRSPSAVCQAKDAPAQLR